MNEPRTLFDKIWDRHVVQAETDERPALLYVDLHLVHEVTSPQAFRTLRGRNLRVRRPDRTLATIDHSVPTTVADEHGTWPGLSAAASKQIEELRDNCRTFGVPLRDSTDDRGIVHVIGPESGATQPGMTIVCGDSHTSTHGAFGALAFGIGSTEVSHVLATQCLLQRKPRSMAVELVGTPAPGVTAKDLILAVIGRLGVDGGTGHVIEYRGDAVTRLDMAGRMTLCNMSIEAGARAGLVAPDATTFEYLRGRPRAPANGDWEHAVRDWSELPTDAGARFDATVTVDVGNLTPQITYGTNPGMVMPIEANVPNRSEDGDALEYMQLEPNAPLLGRPIDVAFVGSCTNGRIEDLRSAAAVLRGHRIRDSVRMLVVPGSHAVKAAAEREGLADVFVAAGAEWREPGCSMCIAMNGDVVGKGQLAISTSNRNFRGRQGPGSRTLLASPATVAASAIEGAVADPRDFATTETIDA